MARYVKQTWTDGSGGGTPLSAARMGVIETGVFNADYKAACAVFHNASQSITNNTLTALAFNSERFDTEANAASTIHDTVTNNSRLTCRTAGIYEIITCVEWASNTTGDREVGIRLNGATMIAATKIAAPTANNFHQQAMRHYQLAVNDYVETVVFQSSGGALNVVVVGNLSPEFSMVLVA